MLKKHGRSDEKKGVAGKEQERDCKQAESWDEVKPATPTPTH
jgi:hypothetical protein